jgi:prevent-host-death family protein
MTNQTPSTQTIDVSDIPTRLSSLVERVATRETRVRIEDAGTPVAAIVSAKDLEQLERLEREKETHWQAIAAIGAAFADVPLEELEAQITRILSEGPQPEKTEPERKLA